MATLLRSKAARVVLVIAVAMGALGYVGWRAMQPKLKGATLAEIKAVLPPELLAETAADPAAQARYKKLLSLISPLHDMSYAALSGLKSSLTEQHRQAEEFYVRYGRLRKDVQALVATGPLWSLDPSLKVPDELSDTLGAVNFVRYTSMLGKVFAGEGDYAKAVELFQLALRVDDSMLASSHDLMTYLMHNLLDGIAVGTLTDALANPHFPASDCARILSNLSASPKTDEILRTSLRDGFQQRTMMEIGSVSKMLADHYESLKPGQSADPASVPGTYDAVETAKTYGKLYAEAMANCLKPYSDLNLLIYTAVRADAKKLIPGDSSREADSPFQAGWRHFVGRLITDNERNTIGLGIAAKEYLGNQLYEISSTRRAQRDCVRILLASIIYRSQHGGALPATTAGFVPLLGAWPTDPFNGKPMIYDPKKQVVYSVGKNLKDDGGQIPGLDLGVSLKR